MIIKIIKARNNLSLALCGTEFHYPLLPQGLYLQKNSNLTFSNKTFFI